MERTGLPVVVVVRLGNGGWDGDLGCGGIESRSESRSESGSAWAGAADRRWSWSSSSGIVMIEGPHGMRYANATNEVVCLSNKGAYQMSTIH